MPETTSLRVLIVDDSETDATLMVKALRRGGYEVEMRRVEEPRGLAEALGSDPDVLLSDHSMPAFDSLDVLKLAAKATRPPPVIVVSGKIGEDALVKAFHAGAVDYVGKDQIAHLLVPAVERAIASRRARDALDEATRQLRRQERAMALATFVGGVAHEINNPLSYMVVNAQIAREGITYVEGARDVDDPTRARLEDAMRAIDTIVRGCDRIRTIVYGLQRVVRASKGATERVDVNALLDRAIVHPPPPLRLVRDLRSTCQVEVSPADLSDVLQALVRNAYEAMVEGAGGEVHIATSDVPGGVRIEVRDEGMGIPPDLQPRVFTPFFTTKHTGTGLSLSVARQLIEGYGGTISFDSTPQKGTTFRIELPAAEAKP